MDNGYSGIEFPFEELPAPALTITRDWKLQEFLGYVSTWSAVRRAAEAGHETALSAFIRDMSGLWNGDGRRHRITWPVNMRIGRI